MLSTLLKSLNRHKIAILSLSFLIFMLWVIYQADSGEPTVFHRLIKDIPFGDKIGHFFLFGMLALLSDMALNLRVIGKGTLSIRLGSLLVFTFASIEEVSQMFFPQRTFDVLDLLASVFGIMVFGLLTTLFAC